MYLFYFLNPIIIYAIYIHSQLDIIPIAFLVWSIYFLIQKNYKISAFIFGLALATKFHIVVALPLILFYLYKSDTIKEIILFIFISFFILILLDFPFLFSDGFISMVVLNQKQSLLFDSFYHIGDVKLLLPIAAILSIYMHFFNQNKINNDLLFFYFGILFVSILLLVYPAPAWYVWIVPFISIYFIQNKNQSKSLLLYLAFSLSYLLFFIFFYQSEYKDIYFLGNYIDLKIDNENLINISYTLLEVMLLAVMYVFYKYGIKSNSIYKKSSNLVIGIGGDSGSGKTTLLANIKNLVGNDKVLQIEGDGEHKWERGDSNWKNYTHLDPKANYIHKQAEAIFTLKNNLPIYRRDYEHSSGTFTKPIKIEPRKFIVIAGLHPFYLPKLRKNIDLKIYLDTDKNLRKHWKILRDTNKRGYTKEKILDQLSQREEDAQKYIYPQKEFSDLTIKYFAIEDFAIGDEKVDIKLGLELTIDANIHLEDIFPKLDCEFIWDYNNDLKTQFIKLFSNPQTNFTEVALESIENIEEITTSKDIKLEDGYNGFIQLISLIMISEKLKEVENE